MGLSEHAAQELDHAMNKLRDEMAAKADHPGIQEIGSYMTARLMDRQEDAGQVLAEGKTLTGAFEAIHAYASKHKTGNFAYVPPEQAFKLVAEYYGIDEYEQKQNPQALADLKLAAASEGGLDFDLDAMLDELN